MNPKENLAKLKLELPEISTLGGSYVSVEFSIFVSRSKNKNKIH